MAPVAAHRPDPRRRPAPPGEAATNALDYPSGATFSRADAVGQIGAGHWRHVPVGTLLDGRHISLHPQLVALISEYRDAHVDPGNALLLPRENGMPMDGHGVTRYLNQAATGAGMGHVHPHQLRQTLATQAINGGMSLEAIAAMLGHPTDRTWQTRIDRMPLHIGIESGRAIGSGPRTSVAPWLMARRG